MLYHGTTVRMQQMLVREHTIFLHPVTSFESIVCDRYTYHIHVQLDDLMEHRPPQLPL